MLQEVFRVLTASSSTLAVHICGKQSISLWSILNIHLLAASLRAVKLMEDPD